MANIWDFGIVVIVAHVVIFLAWYAVWLEQ
jgi:hypothetical protein